MAVLSCKCELSHFASLGAIADTGVASWGVWDATRLREVVKLWGGGGVRDLFLPGPLSDFYYQYDRSSASSGSTSSTNANGILSVGDRASGTRIARWYGGDNAVPQRWDGSAWVTVGTYSQTQFTSGGTHRIGIRVKIDAVAGVLQWLIDGTVVEEYTGDTTVAGIATCDFADIYGGGSGSTSRACSISGAILADTNPSDAQYCVLAPSAAGATNTMDVGTYADVDDSPYNAADFMAGVAGQQVTMTFGDMPATMPSQIAVAFLVLLAAKGGAAAPQNVQGVVRHGGVDAFTASAALPEAAAGNPTIVRMPTNPATGAAWVGADVSADEFGFKLLA